MLSRTSAVSPPPASPPNKAAQRRLQMADIARLAGVSASTVSRALNGSHMVNAETRARIEELARSLKYSINVGAKSLRMGNNNTIGLVIPYDARTRQHISDPFFLSILGSIADALTDQGYHLLLSRVDSERLDSLAELYDTGRAMGIIVIGQWAHHDQLNALAARHVPIAVWGAQLPQQLYCTVGSDNTAGGDMATEHLLSLGRRRVAFLGDVNLPEVAQRYDGYCIAHRRHGMEPLPELRLEVPFLAEGAREAIAKFCVEGPSFDAMFAASDLLAMTAIGILMGQGRRVPEQVSVVGYDDVGAASHFQPPLTTVRQPIALAGLGLAETLLSLINGESPGSQVLPTSLVLRATTAPPAPA